MATSLPRSLIAGGAISFRLNDGTQDLITQTAQRTYDHIIRARIGTFPPNGLTDEQAKLILSASRLADSELDIIWERVETLDTLGLPDGNWTLLEIHVALHFIQASEGLSNDQMAIQFANSAPAQPTNGVRRRSSYTETGLTLQPNTIHDPMPPPVIRPATMLVPQQTPHVSSGLYDNDMSTRLSLQDQDTVSLDQAGMEPMDLQPNPLSHLKHSKRLARDSSFRTSTTVEAQSIEQFIESRCPRIEIERDIDTLHPPPSQASEVDRKTAKDILARRRRDTPKFELSSRSLTKRFRSAAHKQRADDCDNWNYTDYELNAALREAVETIGDAGVAKALIEMKADVNRIEVSPLSKRGSTMNSNPINYVKIAVLNRNVELVSLFAYHPAIAPGSLVEALKQAVLQNTSNIALILLQRGMDWRSQSKPILDSAIASQNPQLVNLLLRSRWKVDKSLLSQSLLDAVHRGDGDIVRSLVTYGADVSYDKASALRAVVRAQRLDLLLVMIQRLEGNTKGRLASSVITEVSLSNSKSVKPEQRQIIEILMYAGAKGNSVAQILVQAVRAGRRSIAKMLVQHNADLNYMDGEALRLAMASDNTEMFSTLLLGRVKEEIASSLIDEILLTRDGDVEYELMTRLLNKGAKGPALDRALVRAIDHQRIKIVELLLQYQADVNFNELQPLRMAVTEHKVAILNLLLNTGRPLPGSMQQILPLAINCPSEKRLRIIQAIVSTAGQRGIEPHVLDVALVNIVRHPQLDQYLLPTVDILTSAGANVAYMQGKCLGLAAEAGSLDLFDFLIQRKSDPRSLSPVVATCMKLEDPTIRQLFVCSLLCHGIKGPELDQALIDALRMSPMDNILVTSLLERADLSFQGTSVLSTAIRYATVDIVASIVENKKTNGVIRKEAGNILFGHRIDERQRKLEKLLKAGLQQGGLDNFLIREVETKRNPRIVKILLEYGASCESNAGQSLTLAIEMKDSRILEQLISRRPDQQIIAAMLPRATATEGVSIRRTLVEILLRNGSTTDSLDRTLVTEVETPGRRDLQIIRLLLDHGSTVDFSDARVIRFAALNALNVGIFEALASDIPNILNPPSNPPAITGISAASPRRKMSTNTAEAILTSLVPLVMAHPQEVRQPMLCILLAKGIQGRVLDQALVAAVSDGHQAYPTVVELLKHKASVNYNEGEAIKLAARSNYNKILECLLRQNPNPAYYNDAILLAMQAPSTNAGAQRLDRMQSIRLLTTSDTVSQQALNQSLINAVQDRDHRLIEHLIERGADVNHKDGRSLVIATQNLDAKSLILLLRSKTAITSHVCTVAYSKLPEVNERWLPAAPINSFDMELIARGAKGPMVDKTLVKALKSTSPVTVEYIGQIIKFRTPVNSNFEQGASLCQATRQARLNVVEYLLTQGPNEMTLKAGFMAIFESRADEDVLISLVQRFTKHCGRGRSMYFHGQDIAITALYQALHRHGEKARLLEELFENGCDQQTTFPWTFIQFYGPEQASPLLWFLCQGDGGNGAATLDLLLRYNADPKYRTAKSGITPLIMAAKIRNPEFVLKLLEAGADCDAEDGKGRSPLLHATLGNDTRSMKCLIEHGAGVNDESLHTAARQINFSATKLLLDHKANADEPGNVSCHGRTPLAELCFKADISHNPSKLKKTVALLCEATSNLKGLCNGRSLVYQALDNKDPLKMTTALLTTCQITRHSLRDFDSNIYAQGSLLHSPTAYVRHFKCAQSRNQRNLDLSLRCCTLNHCPAPDLERLLRTYDCVDRFWDEQAGTNQPRGYRNPSRKIIDSFHEAEQARQRRLRQEQKQKEQEAAAAAERQRQREEMRLRQERQDAEIREKAAHAAAEVRAIRQKAEAEAEASRRRAEAEAQRAEAEHLREEQERNRQEERERRGHQEREKRRRDRDDQHLRVLKDKSNIQVNKVRQMTNMAKETMKEERLLTTEKRNMINDAADMFVEAGHAGASRDSVGRVLGEYKNGRLMPPEG